MSSYKNAKRDFTKEVHHDGKPSEAAIDALVKAATASKSNKKIRAATAAIRVQKKRQDADTFEGRAVKKVVDGMNKSSIGNWFLGCLNPKHAR